MSIDATILMTYILPALLLWWTLWLLLLGLWKRHLFLHTWREPYFADTPVLIESDDWGPGGAFHAERLDGLLQTLARHRDRNGRAAVLTADCVLAVPDIPAIRSSSPVRYHRRLLDEAFPEIHAALRAGMEQGTLVPQLHGLEHLNGNAFAALHAAGDPRVAAAFESDDWWDWERLDSPLQAHYLDGSHLPTRPLEAAEIEATVATAQTLFQRMFGHPSLTSVAPCYLWDDQVEQSWHSHGINWIQSAGYRCTARDAHGNYLQDPPLIRIGDCSSAGQRYLIRNVMYEPVDGRNTPDSAFAEALRARRQALPVTISTHRYNYTRSETEYRTSLAGLDQLLSRIDALDGIRYLSSPELAGALERPERPLTNPFNGSDAPPLRQRSGPAKIRPFLQRLQQRHPKLRLLALASGLILPLGLLMLVVPGRRR